MKMNKIHSSMANLEALTSKLKMCFGDSDAEPSKEEVNVQSKNDIHLEKKAVIKPKAAPVKKTVATPVKKTQALAQKPKAVESKAAPAKAEAKSTDAGV